MSNDKRFLELYCIKRLNGWENIAKEEKISKEEVIQKHKSVYGYIAYRLGIKENMVNNLYINTKDEREFIDYVFSLFTPEREIGFGSFEKFYYWYKNKDKKCFYCDIEEHIITSLFEKGVLKSKRDRGRHLEIEKMNPDNGYSEDNCVLACYFCNNDKSDIFDEEEYPKFFQNRKEYLEKLYEKNKDKELL